MLKINLSATDAKTFEDGYWKWFKRYQIGSLLNLIHGSVELQKCFFESEEGYISWKKTDEECDKSNKIPENHYDAIKSIILTKPDKLKSTKDDISEKIILNKESDEYKYFIDTYKKIRKSSTITNLFLDCLKLKTCPYCNRSFFAKVNKKKNKIYMTVELDHFYPKESNPIMGIVLYNLIPSCHTCNHLKSFSSQSIVNPYIDEYGDDGKFKFDDISAIRMLIDSNSLNSSSQINYSIESDKDIVKNSIEIFAINDLYKSHHNEVIELIHKKRIYTEEFMNECFNNLKENGYSKEQIFSFAFSHYKDSSLHSDKILSKFLNDLYNDLDRK